MQWPASAAEAQQPAEQASTPNDQNTTAANCQSDANGMLRVGAHAMMPADGVGLRPGHAVQPAPQPHWKLLDPGVRTDHGQAPGRDSTMHGSVLNNHSVLQYHRATTCGALPGYRKHDDWSQAPGKGLESDSWASTVGNLWNASGRALTAAGGEPKRVSISSLGYSKGLARSSRAGSGMVRRDQDGHDRGGGSASNSRRLLTAVGAAASDLARQSLSSLRKNLDSASTYGSNKEHGQPRSSPTLGSPTAGSSKSSSQHTLTFNPAYVGHSDTRATAWALEANSMSMQIAGGSGHVSARSSLSAVPALNVDTQPASAARAAQSARQEANGPFGITMPGKNITRHTLSGKHLLLRSSRSSGQHTCKHL